MQSTESLITVCFNSSLLKYGGDIAVGAMTVLSSIMQFAMMPLQGLTQGAQPIISYNYGARNPERVRRAFRVLLMACVAYSLLLWALVHLIPDLFALMFTSDQELVDYAAWALPIYMGATGIFGIQTACQQTFVALGNAKISLFLAILRKIILLIPLIYILPLFFGDKLFGVLWPNPLQTFGGFHHHCVLPDLGQEKPAGQSSPKAIKKLGRGIAAALLSRLLTGRVLSQDIAAIAHQILFGVQFSAALHQLLLEHRGQGIKIQLGFQIHLLGSGMGIPPFPVSDG